MAADAVRSSEACCESLKEVMESEEFEPLIAVDEDGILYMSIGVSMSEEDDEPDMVDHPLYLLPVLRHQGCRRRKRSTPRVGADALTGRHVTVAIEDSRSMAGTFKFELVTPERMLMSEDASR